MGTITYEWPEGTIGILDRIVAMVPSASILHSPESIVEFVTRSDWALGDTIHAIHVHCQPLPDAVPMHTCAVML